MKKAILGALSINSFLTEYWKKKPLLIRNAYPNFINPVNGDDLAGLACSEDVESRIVYTQLNGKAWQLKQGPFEEAYFTDLPEEDWSLLVQGVDNWSEDLSHLLDDFRFLPNWQLDDIMASYSPKGGSVGPHFDEYDVFLLQATGTREWKIGQLCDHNMPYIEGTPLRILKHFEQQESWILEPGDMLYLPPRFAHYGIALEECITLSVGFRSPSHEEIIDGITTEIIESLPPGTLFSPPKPDESMNPGLISEETIRTLQNQILEHLTPDKIANWFAKYSSEPKTPQEDHQIHEILSHDEIETYLTHHDLINWNEGSRFCYFENTTNADITLYVDGHVFQLTAGELWFAELLCKQSKVETNEIVQFIASKPKGDLQPSSVRRIISLITELTNKGSLYFDQ